MKTIQTIIVDDEPLALDLLRNYLAKNADIEIVAECQNGRQAIASVNAHQPDLMFLDIQMPSLSGFEVIHKLQADVMPLIVFITAYDQYALEAFDVYAVDYLLKPLDEEHLQRAINRCRGRLENQRSSGNKADIIKALRKIGVESIASSIMESSNTKNPISHAPVSPTPLASNKIVIKDRDVISLIDQQTIDWIDAAGDYMCIHAAGETHIMRSTLKALLAQLNPKIFQRVHRSTIVNLTRIDKIIPCAKGEYILELNLKLNPESPNNVNNDQRIKVSRNFKSAIKDLITQE